MDGRALVATILTGLAVAAEIRGSRALPFPPRPYPIHLVVFRDWNRMMSTFLRFQEHYDSPVLKGAVFGRGEVPRQSTARKVQGYNVPGSAFRPFLDGRFDPLSADERRLLDIVRPLREPYYVIAAPLEHLQVLGHEIAHGMFFCFPTYAEQVRKIVRKHDPDDMIDRIRGYGYDASVAVDELNAYALTRDPKLPSLHPDLVRELRDRFRSTFGWDLVDDEAVASSSVHWHGFDRSVRPRTVRGRSDQVWDPFLPEEAYHG